MRIARAPGVVYFSSVHLLKVDGWFRIEPTRNRISVGVFELQPDLTKISAPPTELVTVPVIKDRNPLHNAGFLGKFRTYLLICTSLPASLPVANETGQT